MLEQKQTVTVLVCDGACYRSASDPCWAPPQFLVCNEMMWWRLQRVLEAGCNRIPPSSPFFGCFYLPNVSVLYFVPCSILATSVPIRAWWPTFLLLPTHLLPIRSSPTPEVSILWCFTLFLRGFCHGCVISFTCAWGLLSPVVPWSWSQPSLCFLRYSNY